MQAVGREREWPRPDQRLWLSCALRGWRETVRRRRQPLGGRDGELEEGDAAARVVSGDQEAHAERPEMDGFSLFSKPAGLLVPASATPQLY